MSPWIWRGTPRGTRRTLNALCRVFGFHRAAQAPTEPFGENGVYVGEFGLPESEATPKQVLERTTALLAEARHFGCPYAVYWQLYSNEPTTKPPKVNADYKGFWLVRPDGTRSLVCQLFQ